MGCNCKKKTQVLNNKNSKDHLLLAVDLYDNKQSIPMSEFTDLDWLEVYSVYNALYPNSSVVPNKQDAWTKIVEARDLYYTKFKTKTKR
jgi:hypothetical protein